MRWGEKGAATACSPREPHKILCEKLLVQAKLAEAQAVLRALDKLDPGRGTVVSWTFQVASCIVIHISYCCLPPICVVCGFNRALDGSMKNIQGGQFTHREFPEDPQSSTASWHTPYCLWILCTHQGSAMTCVLLCCNKGLV